MSIYLDSVDLALFKPEISFKYFDYWEERSANNTKLADTHEHNYGKGYRKYVWSMFILHDSKDSTVIQYFAVVEEKLTQEEKIKLAPYCKCDQCKMYWFNPFKYLTSSYGCITFCPSQETIKETRIAYSLKSN